MLDYQCQAGTMCDIKSLEVAAVWSGLKSKHPCCLQMAVESSEFMQHTRAACECAQPTLASGSVEGG